jgi:ABC-type transporter Mla subunit MlaD
VIRRLTSAIVVIVACVAVLVTTGGKVSDSGKGGKTFKIAFDNAFGLTEGGDLRVGGVKAGATKTFDISKGAACETDAEAKAEQETGKKRPPRPCAIVTAQISEPGFGSFRSDASCEIRQQSLIGEYYVDCQPGKSKEKLKSGATINAKNTISTIPADLVQNVLRRPYRERLRLIIAELGTGLAGRPQDISELLHKAHPGLRETDKVLKILADQDTTIKNFISDSNTVVRQLDERKGDLQRWLVEASRTADVSASRRGAISAGFQRLPIFLDELRPTMARLADLTDAQTPLLLDLQDAAPSLNTFFTRLGPFSEASRPAFRSLGDASVAGRRAFIKSNEEIATLRRLARNAPGAGKPLRQFLQTLDNRDRAVEKNGASVSLGPPAPDPTAAGREKGLTGYEALASYFYWQALSINEFDSISHVLRAVLIQDPDCSPYQNDLRSVEMGGTAENEAIARRCNSWLGPNQPGSTTPDWSTNGGNQKARTPAKKRGERRRPGDPEAGPLPGQTDYSRPNPTLPPSQQELLDHLQSQSGPSAGSPSAPPVDPSSATGVLDFLLGR